MQFSFKDQHRKKLYAYYILVFIAFFLVTYGIYLAFGYSLISTHDVLHQHVPIMLKYREILISWLHHFGAGPLQWSWQIGLGADSFQTFSYYIIGDPFAYLILLFSKIHLLFGFQFISVLRLFFAGLSFVYFASHYELRRWAIVLGSLVYLSSGFALYASLFQPFFVNALILLPLLITSIEAIIQGKTAWEFGLVVYFAIVANFYLAFMLAVGGICYLLIRWFQQAKPFGKYTLKNIGRMVLAGVVALLATAWITLPEIKALQSSPRLDVPFASGEHLYSLQYYLKLPSTLLGNVNVDPFWLNTLSINALLIIVIWTIQHRQQYRITSILFLITSVLSLLPVFAAVLNGFTSPSNRWLFLMSLPLAVVTAAFFQQLHQMVLSDWILIFKWTFVVLIGVLASTIIMTDSATTLILQLGFLMIYAGVFVAGMKHPRLLSPIFLTGLVLVNISVAFNFENSAYDIHQFLPRGQAETLVQTPYGSGPSDSSKVPNEFATNSDSKDRYAPTFKRTSNLSTFSITKGGVLPNNFLLNDSNTSSFYSIQNGAAIQFSRDLLNVQRQLNLPIQQVDDRARILNFLGVQDVYANAPLPSEANVPHNYLPAFGDSPELNRRFYGVNGDVQIFRTTDNFPLAYFQPRVISDKTYQKLTATDKEANLANVTAVKNTKGLDKVSLTDQTVEIPYQLFDSNQQRISTSAIANTNKQTNYTLYIPNAAQYQKMDLRAVITNVHYGEPTLHDRIQIDKLNMGGLNGQLSSSNNETTRYGSWDAFKRDVSNGSPNQAWRITLTNDDVVNSLSQIPETNLSEYEKTTDGVLNLGWVNKMPNGLKLNLGQVGQYSFDLKLIGIPMDRSYHRQVSGIQKQGLQQLVMSHNKLSGTVVTKETGVLASSIPYSSGWSATVNGKKKQVIKTNRAFVGVKLLHPGKQHIKLTYQTPGLHTGIMISLGIVFILTIGTIFMTIFRWRKNNG